MILLISDKPRCVSVSGLMVAVSESSPSNPIPCETEGLPEATSYRWTLNTSKGLEQIFGLTGSLNIGRDQLGFSWNKDHIGEVKCWAANSLGESTRPCVFHLVAAGN